MAESVLVKKPPQGLRATTLRGMNGHEVDCILTENVQIWSLTETVSENSYEINPV